MNVLYTENDYSEKLVAFVDILGFKQYVQKDTSKAVENINLIDGIIQHALGELKRNHGKTFSPKLFSDNICISCAHTAENLFYMIYELAFIQWYFSLNGFFLRGALTNGNHFENERMIFSKGLIKAYEIEQGAIYPRILIDQLMVDRATNDESSFFPFYVGFKKREFIMQSSDGKFFVDYLHTLYEEGLEQLECLETHKQVILAGVEANRSNPKVLEKYRWAAEYHNFKFEEMFDQDGYYKSYADEITKKISIDLRAAFPGFSKL